MQHIINATHDVTFGYFLLLKSVLRTDLLVSSLVFKHLSLVLRVYLLRQFFGNVQPKLRGKNLLIFYFLSIFVDHFFCSELVRGKKTKNLNPLDGTQIYWINLNIMFQLHLWQVLFSLLANNIFLSPLYSSTLSLFRTLSSIGIIAGKCPLSPWSFMQLAYIQNLNLTIQVTLLCCRVSMPH